MPRAEQRNQSLLSTGPEHSDPHHTDALNQNNTAKIIQLNQITAQMKHNYITDWETQTQQQSQMQSYLGL